MKNCPDCGAEAADDAASCSQCGHELAAAVSSAEQWIWKRPNGFSAIMFGWIAMAAGVILAGIAAVIPNEYGSPPEPDKWPAIWIGVGLFNVGLFLWGVGQILKAIYFLPGEDEKKRP